MRGIGFSGCSRRTTSAPSSRLGMAKTRPSLPAPISSALARVKNCGGPKRGTVGVPSFGPGAAGQSLNGLKLHERAGVVVFALREAATHRHVFNPAPDRPLAAGDVLIACADVAQLATARRIAMEG